MLAFFKANSKALAAIVGAVLSLLAAKNLIPAEWVTDETTMGVVGVLTALVVWLAPANSKP